MGSDPDGENLTLNLDFQYQGSSVFSTSDWTATLSPPQYGLLAGDTVSCVATLTDGYGGSVQLSDSVTLSSSAPALSNITLSPGVAYTGTTVTCSGIATDPNDGDLSSSIQYEWLVGASVVGTGSTYLIDSVQTDVNDTLICSVTIVDSHGESDTATTSILIGNTVPSVTSVSITPSTITNDDVLTCTGTATDPDDAPALSYSWITSGNIIGSSNTLDLSGVSLIPGDVIECAVTAMDAQGASDTNSTSSTVSNRAPSTPVVNISWSGKFGTAIAGDTLTCTAHDNGS